MSNIYNLSNPGHRRHGLTRNGYPYQTSLHEPAAHLKSKIRTPSPEDVFAPPQDSSDEASNKAEKERDIDIQNQYQGEYKSKSKSPESFIPGKNDGPVVTDRSTINPTIFTSLREADSVYGSQASKKLERNQTGEDQEDMFGMWSQPPSKRPRTAYSSSQRSTQENIHHNAAKPHTTTLSQSNGNSKDKSRNANMRFLKDVNGTVAKVDNFKDEDKGAKYKTLPSTEASPRASKAQARSSQKSVHSSQESTKPPFRVLKQMTPRKSKQATFRAPQRPMDGATKSKDTKSTRSSRKPLMFADPNDTRAEFAGSTEEVIDPVQRAKEHFAPSNEVRNATILAQQKLGSLAQPCKLPASSKTESPIPSPLSEHSNSSSALSIPPPETPSALVLDTSATQKNIDYVNNITLGSRSNRRTRCPICKEIVDQLFLDGYSDGNRLKIREQAQFCKAHKKYKAEIAWEDRSFPQIKWQELDERLKDFHGAIDGILQGKKPSFYRNAFEDVVKNRYERTLQKDPINGKEIEELTPGYYGSKGARVMVENLMARFAPKLRRQAASDKLISAGGVSAYVQAVLVPELAVLLVMDDLNIDVDKARETLRDSIEIGNLLNEEEDEIIKDADADEDMKRMSEVT